MEHAAILLAGEQKARVTYDNILRLVDDPDVRDVIKFLREREIVHFQRFGDTKLAKRVDFQTEDNIFVQIDRRTLWLESETKTGYNRHIKSWDSEVQYGT